MPITSSHPAAMEQKVLSKTRTAKYSSLTRFTGQCTQTHTKEIIMPLSIQVPSRKIISTVSTVDRSKLLVFFPAIVFCGCISISFTMYA